jgi:predicted flavoprotein YhiN
MRQFNAPDACARSPACSHWPLVASGTEGYRTAEVTLGGVDTDELSSSTMQSSRGGT